MAVGSDYCGVWNKPFHISILAQKIEQFVDGFVRNPAIITGLDGLNIAEVFWNTPPRRAAALEPQKGVDEQAGAHGGAAAHMTLGARKFMPYPFPLRVRQSFVLHGLSPPYGSDDKKLSRNEM